jgi:Fe2+ or Zn2+ uptake regulation protein
MSSTKKKLPHELRSTALFARWLRAQGLKLTPQRTAVLEVLRNARAPLSVEALAKKAPRPHLVTLYRTLAMLERAGVVRKVGFNDERARFELAFDHHHHLVCTSCEVTEDVDIKDRELERRALARSKQFRTIERHTLEFFGICNRCIKT